MYKLIPSNFTKAIMHNRILFCFLLIFCSLLRPENSIAANYFLQSNTVFTTPAVTTADAFYFNISPDRSYCVEALTTTGTSWAVLNVVDTVDENLIITNSNRGEASSPVYPVFVPNLTPRARRCIISSGNYLNISSYRLQVSLAFTGQNLGIGVLIQLNETTLIGGYNTSVSDYNFLELTNILVANTHDNGVITGKFIVRNSTTDQIVTTKTFTVNPQDRIDINIHEIVGPKSFGSITLLHNGPAGGLKGNVAQYRIVGGNPQDFEPVMQQPLLRVNGLP